MSDIYKEFGVDFLRTRYAGPSAAEMKMAQEITRLRAENIHLRRAGMNRPSAELHEAALAELRADNERLRARVEVLERACRLIEADPDPNAVVECVACYRHSRLAYHALEAKP